MQQKPNEAAKNVSQRILRRQIISQSFFCQRDSIVPFNQWHILLRRMIDPMYWWFFKVFLTELEWNLGKLWKLWKFLCFCNAHKRFRFNFFEISSCFNRLKKKAQNEMTEKFKNCKNWKARKKTQSAADVRQNINCRDLSLLDCWIEFIFFELHGNFWAVKIVFLKRLRCFIVLANFYYVFYVFAKWQAFTSKLKIRRTFDAIRTLLIVNAAYFRCFEA